jgi:glycosyltransferase 2 family protein
MRSLRPWILGFVVLAVFVAVFRGGKLPLMPPAQVLAKLDYGWLIAAFFIFQVSVASKYGRIYYLVRPFAPIAWTRTLNIGAISGALVTLLPLRLGELARPALLREKGKLSALHLASTVAVERIVDGVAFGATLLGGLWLAPPRDVLPNKIGNLPVPVDLVLPAARWLTVGFMAALLVMAVAYSSRTWFLGLVERILEPISPKLAARVAKSIRFLVEGLEFLKDRKLSVPYLGLTILHIATHVWALQWLGYAVGLGDLGFIQSATLVGCLAIGFAFPNAPGFFGSVQLALYAGLGLYLEPTRILEEGAALTALFYAGFLLSVFGAAGVAVVSEYGLGGWSRLRQLGSDT